MKMIIYNSGNEYAVTTLKNYNSYIQNAREIKHFPKSEWAIQDIIDMYCKYTTAKASDFVIQI